MASLQIHQFPYDSDNYGVLLYSRDTGDAVCIDAGNAEATQAALQETGTTLGQVLVTHHHADHVAGLARIKRATGCEAIGPGGGRSAIEGIDRTVADGDRFEVLGCPVEVLHTPGHTLDMLNYHLPEEALVFTGDTLFALGCGRLFEGDASTMWDSLQKLMALPRETTIHCGHEYSQANARFALSVDPDNEALQERARVIDALRSDGKPTIPTTLAAELDTNPFLRPADQGIRKTLHMPDASDAEVFAEIRRRKDNF